MANVPKISSMKKTISPISSLPGPLQAGVWLAPSRAPIRTCFQSDRHPFSSLNRLCGCSLPSFCWQDLASALASNQRLEVLDLGQNSLGQSGITVLFEALKQRSSPLKRLRLRADESSAQTQKLLKEVRDSNPKLNIDCKAAQAASSFYGEFPFFTPQDNFPVIY